MAIYDQQERFLIYFLEKLRCVYLREEPDLQQITVVMILQVYVSLDILMMLFIPYLYLDMPIFVGLVYFFPSMKLNCTIFSRIHAYRVYQITHEKH